MLTKRQLDGVVVGVNPIWFKDKNEHKYLWLGSIYEDRDEFVSLKTNTFEFNGLASLHGLSIAGVSGYYYHGVNDIVGKGLAVRVNTFGEQQILSMLQKKRAHVGIVSSSVFKFLKLQESLPGIYHFSRVPHDAFKRRMFTSKKHKRIHQHLEPIVASMAKDKVWFEMIANYQ